MRRYLIAAVVTVVSLGGGVVPAQAQAKGSAEASAGNAMNIAAKVNTHRKSLVIMRR